MAKFPNITITQQGLNAIAKSSEKIIYTHIALGDGVLNAADKILNFTDLKSKKIFADIADITNDSNSQITLQTIVSNKIVEKGFYAREIGIYAKLGENGKEFLYGYANAGNNADYMPDNTQPIDELKLKITLLVGNVENVTAVINSSIIFITLEDCRREIKKHNDDITAHGDTFARKKDVYTKSETDNLLKGKANTSHGNHVPKTETANNTRFLRNDNTWQTVTPANIGAPTKTGAGASGTWNINITGNANTATNADKVDGYHEDSFLRYRGTTDANGENTLWNQIGIKEYNNALPESLTGTYTYGAVVSFPSKNDRLDLWYDCYASNNGTGLYYRTGWVNEKKAWARLLDSNNYTNFAPTKTGGGASGTWNINITGNAGSASVAKLIGKDGGTSGGMNFHWSGQGGQPTWLWGGNDGTNMYVYNPANFRVSYATNANSAVNADTATNATHATNADKATTATNATHATNADKATTATTATNATHASSADSATNATTANSLKETLDRPASANVTYNDGKIRYFLATSRMSEGKPPGGDGPVIHLSWDIPLWESQITINNPSGHIQTRTQDNGTWGSWKTVLDSNNFNNYAPTKTGTGASGTWGINISGNAASATNADKLDGYHASDLLRTLGGNKAPVMTDIFDRAGTIDLTAMNATDKANNKAKINKSPNSLQNIWNTSTGIVAYGGDIDMSGGYHRGTLKLTQSYKNFDKILVVGTNDDGNIVFYKLWNVYELIFAFSHSFRFPLYNEETYWTVYGSVRTGAATNYSLSTDTIWSCYNQGAGIIAIYGIKY